MRITPPTVARIERTFPAFSPSSRHSRPRLVGKVFASCILLLFHPGAVLLPPAEGQDRKFRPRTVIPRSFPAIEAPPAVSVAEAQAEDWVKDDELVLGVVVNGEPRAYPINTLTGPQREIINDRLGDRRIAATW